MALTKDYDTPLKEERTRTDRAASGTIPEHLNDTYPRDFRPLSAHGDLDSIVLDVLRHAKMFATRSYRPADGIPTLNRVPNGFHRNWVPNE